MGRIRKSWYERKEVQKVTLDWVKTNCKLSEREFDLLKIIYERKLVRRDHLEIISNAYRKLGANRTILLNKSIRKMFRNMCLDKVHEPQAIGRGNTPCIVSVDKGGSLLLNVPHRKRITHTTYTVNNKDYIYRHLPANFRHINGVNALEVETILFCEENNYNIVNWTHEQRNKVSFMYGEERVIIIPDVLMILEINGKKIAAFIEYDTGSESLRYKEPPIIKDKIIKYKRYRSSTLWQEADWQRHFDKPVFPMIMLVTEDEKRINFFNRKIKEVGLRGVGVYYESYTNVLKKMATMIQ